MATKVHDRPTQPAAKPIQLKQGALARYAALASATAIALTLILHAIYLNVPAEDSFITFRFARHLANGHGIVWNVGEAPVEGYTNFLWMLISALILKLGLDVVLLTQALGVAASLASIWLVVRFAREVFGLPRAFAHLAGLMLAISGPFATWAGSSMETNLFALLILGGCFTFARYIKTTNTRDLLLAQALLFLATLTRPEGLMVFVVLGGIGLVLQPWKQGIRSVVNYLASLFVFIIPFLIYFIWRYQYFGYVLPNTFYAKTGGGLFQYMRGAKYSLLFGLLFVLPLAPPALAYLWERDWSGLRQRLFSLTAWRARVRQYPGLVVCGLVSLVYTAYIVFVGGDYMAMFRFFVPILPLIYLIFAKFAHRLLAVIAQFPAKVRFFQAMLVGAVLLTLLHSTPLEQGLYKTPWFMHGTYRGVQHERWHVARNTLIGEFFRDLKQSDEESLALLGIGIIPYITDMKVHSFHGIVDPAIAHKENAGLGTGVAGHEKVDFVSVILRKPTYIMVDTGDLYPEPQPFPDYPDEIDDFVRQNYELKTAWLVDHANHESGYLHYLKLK